MIDCDLASLPTTSHNANELELSGVSRHLQASEPATGFTLHPNRKQKDPYGIESLLANTT